MLPLNQRSSLLPLADSYQLPLNDAKACGSQQCVSLNLVSARLTMNCVVAAGLSGDADDPLISDSWETCFNSQKWFHESCGESVKKHFLSSLSAQLILIHCYVFVYNKSSVYICFSLYSLLAFSLVRGPLASPVDHSMTVV